MTSKSMEEGARVLVEVCAQVTKGEGVVIVTDEERRTIAQVIAAAAQAVGADERVMELSPRVIDNEPPPSEVAEALLHADVVFLPVTHSLSHTEAIRNAVNAGVRVISLTAFTERQMKEGGLYADFRERRTVCDDVAELLGHASEVRVQAPAGTELSFSVLGRVGNSHSCILDGPGFTAVPNIEANIAPVEGTATGVVVVDGSIPYFGIGVVQHPLRLEISAGMVREITGGEQAKELSSLLEAQADPYVYNLAQFAVGLNPKCTTFTGEMLNDEGVNGTAHIGVGTSANLGGTVQATTHFDAVFRHPTIWLDRVCVMKEGEWQNAIPEDLGRLDSL